MTAEDEKTKSFPNINSPNFIKFKEATMNYASPECFQHSFFHKYKGESGNK